MTLTTGSILYLVLIFLMGFVIILIIDHYGRKRNPGDRALFSLVSIVVKFIISAVAALVWFRVLKNTSTAHLILFFVVYLSFTFTIVYLSLSKLRKKP